MNNKVTYNFHTTPKGLNLNKQCLVLKFSYNPKGVEHVFQSILYPFFKNPISVLDNNLHLPRGKSFFVNPANMTRSSFTTL